MTRDQLRKLAILKRKYLKEKPVKHEDFWYRAALLVGMFVASLMIWTSIFTVWSAIL